MTDDHGTDSMTRKLLYSGLVAGLLCGCQSARQDACCDDCVPPKSCSLGYGKWYDNHVSTMTAVSCAKDDLKELRKSCGKRSNDFDEGFRDAYIDMALGRLAQTPPVPPRKYWTAYYRSCAGVDAVNDWFEGYRAGLNMGNQGGVSRFNRVYSSWGGSGLCDANGTAYGYGGTSNPMTIGALPSSERDSRTVAADRDDLRTAPDPVIAPVAVPVSGTSSDQVGRYSSGGR